MDIFTHNVFWLGKMGHFTPDSSKSGRRISYKRYSTSFWWLSIIVAKFEVYTSNTLGEIDEQFSSVRRKTKKKLKIQLKVFQENNSLGGFAQTNNKNKKVSTWKTRVWTSYVQTNYLGKYWTYEKSEHTFPSYFFMSFPKIIFLFFYPERTRYYYVIVFFFNFKRPYSVNIPARATKVIPTCPAGHSDKWIIT